MFKERDGRSTAEEFPTTSSGLPKRRATEERSLFLWIPPTSLRLCSWHSHKRIPTGVGSAGRRKVVLAMDGPADEQLAL
jgi:hypothetical protein